MCMIEGADSIVELFKERDVRARKPAKCGECGRAIEIGEIYHSEAGKFDGDFVTYKTCRQCVRCRDWLISECRGFLYEGVYEDLAEHLDESFTFSLGRLVVGMKRKWKRFDGAGLINLVQAK